MQKYIFLIFLMGFISLGFAQNAISGTIKNQNNEPISNVEISILDATIQTKSNENGQFEIKNLIRTNFNWKSRTKIFRYYFRRGRTSYR